MSRVDDRPWFKFRPDRWLGDAGLQSCSLAAQGLWINLVALMHQSKEYGHLTYKGRAATVSDIVKMLPRLTHDVVESCLNELAAEEVFSRREDDDCIYSRRMVDEYKKSVAGSETRAKGWENQRNGALVGDTLRGPLVGHKRKKENKNKRENNAREPRVDGVSIVLTDVWAIWPKRGRERTSKAKVKAALERLSGENLRRVLGAAESYLRSNDARKNDGEYVPGLHTWLRDKLDTWIDLAEESKPSRHLLAASKQESPDWFSKLELRFIDANLEKDWQTIWSRCIPVSDGNPVVLRAPSKAIYRTATQPNDMLRFMTAVGRPVDLQPPTSPSRSR